MNDAISTQRPVRAWALLALGACVVLGAMGIVTWQTLRMERREARAVAQAEYQQSLRLALWRMDSALTPVIAREASRPYFEYQPFYESWGAIGREHPQGERANEERVETRVLVPSPLLAPEDGLVRLHFQVENGRFASPQVPTGDDLERAEQGYTSAYAIEAKRLELRSIESLIAGERRILGFSVPASRATGQHTVRAAGEASRAEAAVRDGYKSPANVAVLADSGATESAVMAEKSKEASGIAAAPEQPGIAKDKEPVDVGAELREQSTYLKQQGGVEAEYQARVDAANRANDVISKQTQAQVMNQQRSASRGAGKVASPSQSVELQKQAPAATASANAPRDVQTLGEPPTGGGPLAAAPQASTTATGNPSATLDESAYGATPAGARASAPARAPAAVPGHANENVWSRTSDLNSDELAPASSAELIEQGAFTPQWLGGESGVEPTLIFSREVKVGGKLIEQCFVVDWPRLRTTLLEGVQPLLGACTIQPVRDGPAGREQTARMLATIPAELVVASPLAARAPAWTPMRTALVASWLLVLGAIGAIFGVARASMELAERRGRFVSAVTHELRTPLTTFTLYSQMLADGMVQGDEDKKSYARTLHGESLRLSRIVESVLDFARLGRGGAVRIERTTLGALRSGIEPALASACERCGMTLEATSDSPSDAPLRTDAAVLSRIIANLVDNACKYACDAEDKRVVVSWGLDGENLRVRVRDFGVGVPEAERPRIFHAFVRGGAHAHGSVPGLGLGLALSRELAEQLGGGIELSAQRDGASGAEFVVKVRAG